MVPEKWALRNRDIVEREYDNGLLKTYMNDNENNSIV
jgi:hypothetical protein